MDELVTHLEKYFKKGRKYALYAAILLFIVALGLGILILVTYFSNETPKENIGFLQFLGILVAFFAFCSAFMLYAWKVSENTQNHPIYKLLFKTPEKLLWIYVERKTHQTYGIQSAVVYSLVFVAEKKHFSKLIVDNEEEAKMLLAKLKSRFPNVDFGYTPEKKKKYLGFWGTL